MAYASILLTMTGEQCQHLVNMLVANHAETHTFCILDRAARALTRGLMRHISRFEQGTTNVIFSLAQEDDRW